MSITSLAHVCIFSSDLEETRRFYCEGLGMRKEFSFVKEGRTIGFYIRVSENNFIEIFHADDAKDATQNGNLRHFCLETDSVEATRKRLVDCGYEPGPIKMGADESYQFWIKDPSGVALEFHEYTPRSSQKTGADVEVNW